MTALEFDYLCKDPYSKFCHLLRLLGFLPQHVTSHRLQTAPQEPHLQQWDAVIRREFSIKVQHTLLVEVKSIPKREGKIGKKEWKGIRAEQQPHPHVRLSGL